MKFIIFTKGQIIQIFNYHFTKGKYNTQIIVLFTKVKNFTHAFIILPNDKIFRFPQI